MYSYGKRLGGERMAEKRQGWGNSEGEGDKDRERGRG